MSHYSPMHYLPINMVTPFTYHDGMTYLARLEYLCQKINEEIVPAVNEAVTVSNATSETLAGILTEVDARLALFASQQADILSEFRTEMIGLIHEATGSGTALNPTNGRIEPVAKVISDLYDNVRVHAYSALELDGLDLTALEYDERAYWLARYFDLTPYGFIGSGGAGDFHPTGTTGLYQWGV